MPQDAGKLLRIVFDVPDSEPTRFATSLVVQHGQGEFTLNFFEIRPPLLVGTDEEKAAQLAEMDTIKAVCVGRIAVASDRMEEFIDVLSRNYQQFRELRRKTQESQP